MVRVIGLALAGLFMLSGCGFEGSFRYPCQDPANFDNPECNPPLCKVEGQCTIDILGFDPKTGEAPILEENGNE